MITITSLDWPINLRYVHSRCIVDVCQYTGIAAVCFGKRFSIRYWTHVILVLSHSSVLDFDGGISYEGRHELQDDDDVLRNEERAHPIIRLCEKRVE